jgi:hypothetical protein
MLTDTTHSSYVVFEEIDDDDVDLKHCVGTISRLLTAIETLSDTNEATRCEFISAILLAAVCLARKVSNEDIFISFQKHVAGEEATGRVDYSIQGKENLICIAEGKPRNIKIGYLQVWSVSNVIPCP